MNEYEVKYSRMRTLQSVDSLIIFAKLSIPAAVLQRFFINRADGETPANIILTSEKY
jgi:hypothetical protein